MRNNSRESNDKKIPIEMSAHWFFTNQKSLNFLPPVHLQLESDMKSVLDALPYP